MIIDRTEWFTLGRYPVAIIGHNYQEDVEKLKQLPAVLDGRLVIPHSAGRQGGGLGTIRRHAADVLTRPDVTKSSGRAINIWR